MSEGIIYSEEELFLSVEAVIQKMRTFQYTSRFQVLGSSFLEKLKEWEQLLQERRKEPFTIVVVGEFKRGKSTFINALLGEAVAPVNVLPETMTLNRISYGSSRNEAVLPGHKRMLLTDEELKNENLRQIMKNAGVPIQRLELKRPCELLKRITVIDTPGLNDSAADFGNLVEEALLQADAVVYVYNSVDAPLSMSEQIFLKSAVLPQKYTKLFLVGNYADILEKQEEFDRVRRMLAERVHPMLPNAEVVLVSALDELCRKLGKPRPNQALEATLAQEFESFRRELDRLLREKENTVIVDRLQRLTDAMLRQLRGELDAAERGLSMSREDAAGLLHSLREEKQREQERLAVSLTEVRQMAEECKKEAQGWMLEFLKRIEQEAESLYTASEEELRKYYSYYCTDLLQEALSSCLEYHQEAVFEQLESISEKTVKRIGKDFLSGDIQNVRMNLDNRIWTKGDTVGLMVSLLATTGFLGTVFKLGVNAVAGGLRQKEKENRVPELVEQIKRGFTAMEIQIAETLNILYSKLADTAQRILTEAIQEDADHMDHLMEKTVRAASLEQERKEELMSVLQAAREILTECELMLRFE